MTDALFLPPRRDTLDRIDRLAVSADAKVLLARLLDATATVAGRVVEIGRRILSFVMDTVRLFPNTTFGVIIGYVMMLLIGSMAALGALLGPMLGPLLVALGMGIGAVIDVQDGALRARVDHYFGDVVHA